MANNLLEINQVTIQDFQGLNGKFEFDLRSPVTIIHAPNGTGKTTVCKAVEWALTGKLEKRSVNISQLECKFSKGSSPQVNLEFGPGAHFNNLIQSIEGHKLHNTNGDLVTINTTELLRWLTRGAQYLGAHHVREISQRTQWLRAARFLSEENMDNLTSSDTSDTDLRADIFADILGVRELLEQENRLGRYAKELENSRANLQNRINEVEEEHGLLSEQAADKDDESTWTPRIIETYESLGLEPPKNILPDDFSRLDEDLSAEIAEFGSETERMIALLGKLKEASLEFEDNKIELELTRKKLEGIDKTAQHVTEDSAQKIFDQETFNNNRKEFEDYLLALSSDVEAALRAAALVIGFKSEVLSLPNSMTLNAWRKAFPESQEGMEYLELRIQSVHDIQSQTDTINILKQNKEAAQQRRDEAKTGLLSPKVIMKANSQLMELGEELKKARDAIIEVGSIREQIIALGRQLTATSPSSECPLCLQDWDNADRLHLQIDKSDTSSDAVIFLRRQAEKIEQKMLPLAHQLATDDILRRTLTEAASEIDECDTKIAEFSQRIEEMGILPGEGTLEYSLQTRLETLRACHALNRLENCISLIRSRKLEIKLDKISVTQIPAIIRKIVKLHEEPVQSELRISNEKIAQLSRQLEAVKDKTGQIKLQRNIIREKEAGLVKSIKVFSDDWALLRIEDGPIGNFSPVDDVISHRRQALATTENRHIGAKAAWEAHNRSTRLNELFIELKNLNQRNNNIIDRLDKCNSAKSEIGNARRQQEHRTFNVLGDGISAIFPRIHANAMIDAIINPEDGLPSQWIARCGDVDLDPSDHLSHGQRQDLALSIFFSRAASLGGTFFIDDPITHLDDLNRVGLLDVLRALTLGKGQPSRFVITTASMQFTRLIKAKFRSLPPVSDIPPIRIYKLNGDPRSGQELEELSS